MLGTLIPCSHWLPIQSCKHMLLYDCILHIDVQGCKLLDFLHSNDKDLRTRLLLGCKPWRDCSLHLCCIVDLDITVLIQFGSLYQVYSILWVFQRDIVDRNKMVCGIQHDKRHFHHKPLVVYKDLCIEIWCRPAQEGTQNQMNTEPLE